MEDLTDILLLTNHTNIQDLDDGTLVTCILLGVLLSFILSFFSWRFSEVVDDHGLDSKK